jgi:Domain of unknown function (DUF4173)
MPLIQRAGRVLLAAGAFGVIGQVLFFDAGLGVNFPIAIALVLAGGWILRRPGTRIDRWDLWLAPAAIAFASFAAVRADPTIIALDLLTAVALATAALATFGGRSFVARPFWALPEIGLRLAAWIGGGAMIVAASANRHLPSLSAVAHRAAPAASILRGLLIAVPVAIVFVVLFSAADAVFAQLVGDLIGFEIDLGDAGWRLALAAGLAWVATGAIGLAASEPSSSASEAKRLGWRIGPVEVVTVLVVVNAIFLVFVALQAAYLFGGLDTLAASGLSYAEYARRGFAELVVVAILAGSLIIGADRLVRRQTSGVLIGAIGLAVLTGVVIVSAALRLMLYQDAYGWTELRLYVLATIGWLAIGTIGLIVALVLDRVRWMGHALLVAGLAVGLVLNIVGPARFITEQNVARLLDPSLVPPNGQVGLDIHYVLRLGDDAVPALVRALPALPSEDADYLSMELGDRLGQLRNAPGLNAWQAWNTGREAARDALEAAEARGDLP